MTLQAFVSSTAKTLPTIAGATPEGVDPSVPKSIEPRVSAYVKLTVFSATDRRVEVGDAGER